MQLRKHGTFLLNLMSSTGSEKTTTLKATIDKLKDEMCIGVMEADVLLSINFVMKLVYEYARNCNPEIKIYPICAATGEGAVLFSNWLKAEVRSWKSK